LWDRKWKPTEGKRVYKSFIKKTNYRPRRSLQEILQQGTRSLNAPSRGPDATSKPAVEISVKGRDELVVRNLPKVTSRNLLSGVSSSDKPLQGASSSSTPAEGKRLRHLLASKEYAGST
jgi:hypothetical protein